MSAGSSIIGKHQNRVTKVASKAFNIREVWCPVCCYGNKTGMLILWSKPTRIFRFKLAQTSFFIIVDQNSVQVMTLHLSNLHMKKKLEYLSNKKRYLKIMNRILLLENFLIFGNGLDMKNANFVKLLLFNVCCYTNRQYLLL